MDVVCSLGVNTYYVADNAKYVLNAWDSYLLLRLRQERYKVDFNLGSTNLFRHGREESVAQAYAKGP